MNASTNRLVLSVGTAIILAMVFISSAAVYSQPIAGSSVLNSKELLAQSRIDYSPEEMHNRILSLTWPSAFQPGGARKEAVRIEKSADR